MGYFSFYPSLRNNGSCDFVPGQAGIQLLEGEEIKGKDLQERKGKNKGPGRLWLQALIVLVIILSFPHCSPSLTPGGYNGWFEASGEGGRVKGKFFYRVGTFFRLEIGGCSFNIKGEKVFIFDRRRKECWSGDLSSLRKKFPYIPSLEEMGKIWKGEGTSQFRIISRDKRGRVKVMETRDGTLIRILNIRKGAVLEFPHGYMKTRLERICSRLVHTQS